MKTKIEITLSFFFIISGLIINGQENNTDAVLKYNGLRKLDNNIITKPNGKLLLKDGYHDAVAKYRFYYESYISMGSGGTINPSYMKSQFDVRYSPAQSKYYCSQQFLSDIRFYTESNKSYSTEVINCNYIDTIDKNLYFNWPYYQVIEKDTKKEVGGTINTEKVIDDPSSSNKIHMYFGNIEPEENLSKFSINFYYNSFTHLIGRTVDGYNVNYRNEYKNNRASSTRKQVNIYLKPGYYCFTQIFSGSNYLIGKWYQNGYSVNFKAEPNQVIFNALQLISYDGKMLQCNQPSLKSLVTAALNDIYFLPDGIHGWIVGDNGIILRTLNGGNNWTFQKLEHEISHAENMVLIGSKIIRTYSDLNKVYFIDTLNGWVTIQDGGILKTIDGGITWLSQDCKYCNGELFFVNEKEGYAKGSSPFSAGMILSTLDGGTSWKTIHNTPIVSNFYIRDSNDWIWLKGGITGGLFNSTDKGLTWGKKSDMFQFTKKYLNRDIFFIDKNIGWILLQNEFMISDIFSKELLYTENNGITWAPYNISFEDVINSIYFIDKNKGYVVGNNGNIVRTNDGGKTWEKLRSGTLEHLNDVQFIQNKGWIIGSNGGILTTNDGGINWKYLNVLDFLQN
jgi:photosystem II stability/assembly factor-like uncharacterized protein